MKENGPGDFDEVRDFVELVGMLTKRKLLDEERVWAIFYYWINNYWHISQNHISSVRHNNGDNTVWEDFSDLHGRVVNIDNRRRGLSSSVCVISPEDFSQEERSLSIE